MLAQIKLYAIAALSAVIGILYTMFKMRGSKLDKLNKELKYKTAEMQIQKAKDKATQVTSKEYNEEKERIEKKYDEKKREVYKNDKIGDTNLLSAFSLSLLNNRGKKGDSPPTT